MPIKQLLTVKEFSKLTDVKESTLRYYDKLGLFSPAVRKDNGYRYYTPQQSITINAVRLLYELDMPTRDIVELSKNRTPERVLNTLIDKGVELEEEIHRLQRSYNVISTIRALTQTGLNADVERVSVEFRENLGIVLGPENDFAGSSSFYHAFMEFCDDAEDRNIDLRLPVGGYFPDMDSFLADPSRPKHFFSIDPNGVKLRPSGRYLTAYTKGYYSEVGDIAERMKRYADENGVTPQGPVYNIYVFDEVTVASPDDYLMQATVHI